MLTRHLTTELFSFQGQTDFPSSGSGLYLFQLLPLSGQVTPQDSAGLVLDAL